MTWRGEPITLRQLIGELVARGVSIRAKGADVEADRPLDRGMTAALRLHAARMAEAIRAGLIVRRWRRRSPITRGPWRR